MKGLLSTALTIPRLRRCYVKWITARIWDGPGMQEEEVRLKDSENWQKRSLVSRTQRSFKTSAVHSRPLSCQFTTALTFCGVCFLIDIVCSLLQSG